VIYKGSHIGMTVCVFEKLLQLLSCSRIHLPTNVSF